MEKNWMNCELFHPYNAAYYPHSKRLTKIIIPCLTKRSGTFSGNWSMVFVKLICKKKQVNKFVECKLSNWMQGIAWYLTFASVSYQILSNKNQENYSIPCNLLWTVCLIVRSTLTFGSFAKYSANLMTSERASVTWNKLETFLTNNTITETLNNKSFSWNILLEVTGSRLQMT